jgi:two-component system cell cycle response regulator DivK
MTVSSYDELDSDSAISDASMSPLPSPCEGPERPLVLLVDDFEDALAIYGQCLDLCGYRVVMARNGEEAVTAARIHLPQLILLDLRMPVMSGTDALTMIRADPALSAVPIIALTAHALEDERIEAVAAGFDRVVAKPCLPDELVAIVRSFLPVADAAA